MSNLRRFVAVLAAALVSGATAASAQLSGVDEYAQAIAALSSAWKGQKVPRPAPAPRPAAAFVVRSVFSPISVHADRDVSPESVMRALTALEETALWMRHSGWPAPIPDGGRGGDGGFDLYLTSAEPPSTEPHAAWRADADADLAWGSLDGVSAFARLDASDEVAIEPCASAAYADAVLFGQDPAEAEGFRRATAAFLAFRITGRFCREEAVAAFEGMPWRTWPTREGEDSARVIGTLTTLRDGGSAEFLRDMWQFARQKTWEPDFLRGSPDLWECIETSESFRRRALEGLLVDVAAARYVRPSDLEVPLPVFGRARWAELPAHFPVVDPPLETLGAAYVVAELEGASPGQILRVWVRGEVGVRWGLVAVQRDAAGREIGRSVAPAREIAPRAYLPIEIAKGARAVWIAVINLSHRRPDADIPDENIRTFRLVLDRGP